MANSSSALFPKIQDDYIEWQKTSQQTKETKYIYKDVELTVIFNRGCWIYPFPEVSGRIYIVNTINISSKNIGLITLFKTKIFKINEHYAFNSINFDDTELFEMKFFKNTKSIIQKLNRDRSRYEKYKIPKSGVIYECIVS